VRAMLPRIAIRVRRHSDSVGWSVPQQSPALRPKCAPADLKWVKIVVGMQHPPTTFHGRAITPKKSAHACLFCFTQSVEHSRLQSSYDCNQATEFRCSRLSFVPGGAPESD
jgi:hypothetical protein